MRLLFTFVRPGTLFLRTLWLAGVVVALAQPQPLRADVATKAGEKSKKDPEDKKKKDKSLGGYLPEARPGAARFTHGQVDVELVAAVGSLKQMEFVIRQMPKHGTLSAIRPDLREGNKAAVTYTHRGGDAPMEDSFTYACRLNGGSWSAPATVTLTGEKMAPKIEVINLPQFGRVFLGGETSARVSLRNNGTADFRMEVKWPEPFSGPPVIEVPQGGATEFLVVARPVKTGDFRHELVLQPGVANARAIFYAVCVRALSVSPSRLTLVLEGKGGERSGVLSVANARPQPVHVLVKHPARLMAPDETEVAGGSRSDLRIALPAGDVEAFSDEITVTAGDDVQKVSVESAARPAALQVLVPASLSLDFGVVEQRSAPSREIVLGNAGGQTLIVEARVRPPYSLGGDAKSLRLEPHGQVRLKVFLQTDRPGLVPGELNLESNATRVTVSLGADVRETAEEPATSAPSSSPSVSGTAYSPPAFEPRPVPTSVSEDTFAQRSELKSVLMALASSTGIPIPPSQINPYLASVPSIEFISSTSSEVIIAWPKPAMVPTGWVIELASQVLDPNSGMFVKLWTRYRDWEAVDVDGDRVAVRLRNLQPASLYEVRVLAVDREGKVSEPAATRLVQTGLPWRVPSWVWNWSLAALFAVIAYRLYRARGGWFRLASA